jgi:hypothetical protein
MFATYDDRRMVNALTADASFVERIYYIEARDITKLREEASTSSNQRASRVQAVSAYLWKALAAVVAASSRRVPEERCCMGWMVDARRRVKAPALVPALRNYFGNVTAYALADAAVDDILREPLAEVAARVRDTITAIDYDTYLQELVDWVEEHKPEHVMEKGVLGLGTPTVNQTVFASFPFDTDFGFGEATLALPMCEYGRLCCRLLASQRIHMAAARGGARLWRHLQASHGGVSRPFKAPQVQISSLKPFFHLHQLLLKSMIFRIF